MLAEHRIEVRVEHLERLPGDTVAVRLVAANGEELPCFEAGAHIDVEIDEGIVRQYSLCGDPSDAKHYAIAVLRDQESRGGSAAINERLRIDDRLFVSCPKNHFPVTNTQAHSILVGGGIGITPLLAMAHELHRQRRPFELRYCVSDATKASFLETLQRAPFSDRVILHYSRSDAAPRFDPASELKPAAEGAHIYVCGPTGFMDWVYSEAKALGYLDSQLHKEDFGAEVDLAGNEFQIEARASGKVIDVAAGQPIVDALKEAGVHVDVSCERGVCGTCLCDVIEGEPDHRDAFLTEEERLSNEMIIVCCSRSKTPRLVLDI